MGNSGPMSWATPSKVRLKWGALALGLVVCAVYVAKQEPGASGSIQSNTPTAKQKSGAPAERASKAQAESGPHDLNADEPDADYLTSAPSTPSDELYHSDPLHDDEVVPHPITKERIRMADQHALFEHITESLKLKDFRLASQLIDQHETQFGNEEGSEADRRGFALLLACLETRSEHAREQAVDFIEQERISPLRRHVRRVCLNGHDF